MFCAGGEGGRRVVMVVARGTFAFSLFVVLRNSDWTFPNASQRISLLSSWLLRLELVENVSNDIHVTPTFFPTRL